MKMTKMVVGSKTVAECTEDLLVLFVGQAADGSLLADPQFAPLLEEVAKFPEFKGKSEQTLALYPPYPSSGTKLCCRRLLLVGIGRLSGELREAEIYERLRLAGGVVADHCRKRRIERVALCLPVVLDCREEVVAEYLTEGVLLGAYQFVRYKTETDEESYPGLKRAEFLTAGRQPTVRKGVDRGAHTARCVADARDMANEPGNGWTPTHFAHYAKKTAAKFGLRCFVLSRKEMEKLGMGGILAVNQGSAEAPKMVILDYAPTENLETVLLVGKGLTFDSGGISLKPAEKMMEMKYDMCGGAAVLATMAAIAVEKPPLRVVAIVPATDNMNGSAAVKPGDVISQYGGRTVEIENTDAEGRLLLADALAYGIEQYRPDCVIDIATLTGAAVIALGHHYSCLMSNNDRLAERLLASADIAAEPLWRMPLGKVYAKQLQSQVADLKNIGGRPGGAITAAEFLHKFVGETPWAHLDIAGTAWDFTEKSYIPKGPSGIGVRTLLELLRRWPGRLE